MTHPGGAPNMERQPDPNITEWLEPTAMIPHARSASSPNPTSSLPGPDAPPETPRLYGAPYSQRPGWGQQPDPAGTTFGSSSWTAGADAPQAGKRLPLVPILTALSAALFVAAITMTALYTAKIGAYNRAVSQRDSALSAKTAELDTMRGDLQKANEDLGKLKTDLSGSQNQADELKRQKQIISKCFNLLGDMMQAASKGDRATVTKMQPAVNTACREADRYIE